ncbi:MAG: PucR family transcriptional regulator, partial [Sciscionella sp.]
MEPDATPAAAQLRHVLGALGEPLVEVLAAPLGLSGEVSDVVILDPEDTIDLNAGDLVLVIGARGRAAAPSVKAAARAGAAAVAVKAEAGTPLVATATDARIALLGVRQEARWDQVEMLARSVIDTARSAGEAQEGELLGDLFGLAQTIAALTGGIVTIEDTANRVLAYSRSTDEVDELRRLSILGRQGPERYLAMLRDWGVYRRLRSGEGIVRIDERPDLGIRRRIAAGIHAGSRPLGTIWVQEGCHPLNEQSERALLGASRSAAPLLVRQRAEVVAGQPLRENLLGGLLTGRLDADSMAGDIGADASRPAVVAAFALRQEDGAPTLGRTELALKQAELMNLIAVHAAAYRRSALVSVIGGRLYVLLPDLAAGAEPGVLALAREIVVAARRHLGLEVRAALGGTVERLADTATSRSDADRVLEAMARDAAGGQGDVATLADVRSAVLLSELLAMLAEHPRIRDPRVHALAAYDAK